MKKALEGITVLDFSQLLAGPFATMMLADMGATVIKVERIGSGDSFRGMTFFNKYFEGGDSPCFMAWNRNKKSISIDIKNPKAKEFLYKIAKTADVVVENFRPGVMDKLGYGYEDLKKINPKIVYASNSGFGADGPYVTRPGQDMLVQGLVGLTTLTGRKSDPPTPLGTGLPDMLSSFHLVYGILSALIYAQRTGEGQHVEVDLMRSTMALESQEFMTLLNLPVKYERPQSGIGHPFQQAPFGIYPCSDGYISIAMSPYSKLVQALEAPELMCYENDQVRFDKRDEVFEAIATVTRTKSKEYWLKKMLALDIWVAPIQDITEVEFDPQVKHMNAISEFEHKKAGKLRCVAPAVTMSETPAVIKTAPPMVGEHTREILQHYGMDDTSIDQMFAEKIVTEQA
ncbi:CaiB/BaiF CoA-transferase family protein [Oscillospiraceae bacterium PP1C4]